MRIFQMRNLLILLFLILISTSGFTEEAFQDSTATKPKITFLEFGSFTCIPCKQMEKVLESISKKYGDQIKVIFHDVKKNKDIVTEYKIKLIPTQVFLNEQGKEIHRHVGFYPEEKIDEFLLKQGLKVIHSKESKS